MFSRVAQINFSTKNHVVAFLLFAMDAVFLARYQRETLIENRKQASIEFDSTIFSRICAVLDNFNLNIQPLKQLIPPDGQERTR